jgi:hypothetical protein
MGLFWLARWIAHERLAAAFTLQMVGVQAHEIGWRVGQPAVWTHPNGFRNVVSRFSGNNKTSQSGSPTIWRCYASNVVECGK